MGLPDNTVRVLWTYTDTADRFEIDRCSSNCNVASWTTIEHNGISPHIDQSTAAESVYVYRVRAIRGGVSSASSNRDVAATIAFSPIIRQVTTIQAAQMTELRTAINAIRAAAGDTPLSLKEIHMRVVFAVWLVAFAAIIVSPHASAQSNAPVLMTPGLWEITVQLESPDPGPATTSQQCVTPEKSRPVPPKSKAKDDCQIVETPSPANEIAYTVNCSKLKRTSRSQFTYFGDRFEGTVTTDFGKIAVRTKYTARRIGDCESGASGAAAAEE